ncbi:MAG: dihydroorotate dehydrogenase-like protein [Spirochaetia bacterium]
MANLKTKYMGIDIMNPLIAGASNLTAHMDSIKKIEDTGAGALVIKSLFEEQIRLDKFRMQEDLSLHDNWYAEMTNIFPEMEHSGPEEHLMWVRKAKEAVDIPVIASLNAISPETWVEYAKKLEETGVDGLELNLYGLPVDFGRSAQDMEEEQVEVLKEIKTSVSIPVSVKLSTFYTNPVHFVKQLDDAGVDGYVLFNRFFHPSIDIEKVEVQTPFNFSSPGDHLKAIRFMGLFHGRVKGSLCASGGIHDSKQAAEVLLAGADSFQTVSTLYKNGIDVIEKIISGLSEWMDKHGYSKLEDVSGKLSEEKSGNKWIYRRSQYAKLLLHAEKYLKRPHIV